MAKPDQHLWAIDGIEEGVARVEEDGTRMLSIPRSLLPADVREGQIVRVTRTDSKGVLTLTVAVDEQATAAAHGRSAATTARAMAESRKRDPGGDVAL
jgi:hypothetical protein